MEEACRHDSKWRSKIPGRQICNGTYVKKNALSISFAVVLLTSTCLKDLVLEENNRVNCFCSITATDEHRTYKHKLKKQFLPKDVDMSSLKSYRFYLWKFLRQKLWTLPKSLRPLLLPSSVHSCPERFSLKLSKRILDKKQC